MTIRELRDKLNQIVTDNEKKGYRADNNNSVIIILKGSARTKYFRIEYVPDTVTCLDESAPIEYRQNYSICVNGDGEIEADSLWK